MPWNYLQKTALLYNQFQEEKKQKQHKSKNNNNRNMEKKKKKLHTCRFTFSFFASLLNQKKGNEQVFLLDSNHSQVVPWKKKKKNN